MKIVSLETTNTLRLRAVHIKPDGQSLVIIGGKNGSGKTSVLNSIWMALGGKGAIPLMPVRDGETEATIKVDLGEYVVIRTITPDGKSTLKVTGKDGGRFSSPQALLDGLVGGLSFDPLEFSRMDPKRQVETLKALVGLDFSALDRQRAAKAEMRVTVGREVKQLEGQLAGMKQHAGAPAAEVSIGELSAELNAARERNRLADAKERAARDLIVTVEKWKAEVLRLRRQLEEAQATFDAHAEEAERVSAVQAPPMIDESAIILRMTACEATNRQVRENRDRKRIATAAYNKQADYEKLTTEIEGIDDAKADALEKAKFPVPGLSFDESGVMVAGVPFQQASAAEQLKVSVGMALALHSKLKVMLVRDGSLLDADSLAMIAEMAEKADSQVWLERVGSADESAIIIEDGAVRS